MTRSVALIFCVAGLLCSHSASARPRIALTEIAGDASGDVRDAVADALAGNELLLIGNFAVDRAMANFGEVTELTEKDFKRLASELAADAVVSGKLSRSGGARTLKFRVFVGKKLTKSFTMSFKDPRSEKLRTVLHEKMLTRFGVSPDSEATADPPDEDVKAKRKGKAKAKAEEDEDDDVVAKPQGKPGAEKGSGKNVEKDGAVLGASPLDVFVRDRASQSGEDAADAADTDGTEEAAPRRRRKKVAAVEDEDGVAAVAAVDRPSRSSGGGADQRAVRVAAGPSVMQRSLTFVASNIANKPRNVSLSPIAGAYTDGEIYPLALLGRRDFAAGLGLGFEYEQQTGANVQVAGTMSTIPFKQLHYSIGVRFRFMFGDSETSPSLTLRAGYGQRYAASDPRQLTDAAAQAAAARDTPPIIYTVIDPGATFRLPVTGGIALTLAARAMVVTDAGPIQTARLYGAARVFGGIGGASVDVKLGGRFELQVAGEFSQMGFSFQGTGALATQLDGNAATKDVGGLTDRTVGGWATLGFAY